MKNDFSQKRMKQAKTIYVSSYTGNLPCLMVAYLAVPEHRPGVTMQSEVKKCIQELILTVDKAQLQSIVIPVKILDHIPETTFLTWFASAFIEINSPLNFLKQIYLCTDFTKNTELFVEALKSALSKYLNFYNFSHMCGEIGQENVGKYTFQSRFKLSYIYIQRCQTYDYPIVVMASRTLYQYLRIHWIKKLYILHLTCINRLNIC